jgi:hypothetical protein
MTAGLTTTLSKTHTLFFGAAANRVRVLRSAAARGTSALLWHCSQMTADTDRLEDAKAGLLATPDFLRHPEILA